MKLYFPNTIKISPIWVNSIFLPSFRLVSFFFTSSHDRDFMNCLKYYLSAYKLMCYSSWMLTVDTGFLDQRQRILLLMAQVPCPMTPGLRAQCGDTLWPYGLERDFIFITLDNKDAWCFSRCRHYKHLRKDSPEQRPSRHLLARYTGMWETQGHLSASRCSLPMPFSTTGHSPFPAWRWRNALDLISNRYHSAQIPRLSVCSYLMLP